MIYLLFHSLGNALTIFLIIEPNAMDNHWWETEAESG